ncbi:MAG TPA: HAD-IIB family hydrolase [Candidatus Saccharimonadales bacterium]|nr:HAD-IIB family hydrolase [Candidatus Saccharimonadales bacterium]
MVRKVIAFDLDGTLAPSKSPLPDRMGLALNNLLGKYQVCVISGGKFEQFEKQLLTGLKAGPEKLAKLHLMPTCGTRYYRFNSGEWQKIYAEDFAPAEKKKIIDVLNKVVDELGYREKRVWGQEIEDRESQITYSALGQDIVEKLGKKGVKMKYDWDPDNSKKNKIRDLAAPLLPEFEVRVGGVTSIDVTKPGIDKAYGMQKLMAELSIKKEDILFIGDRLSEGGNDYPVKAFGIDCMEISDWQETALAVEAIVNVS